MKFSQFKIGNRFKWKDGIYTVIPTVMLGCCTPHGNAKDEFGNLYLFNDNYELEELNMQEQIKILKLEYQEDNEITDFIYVLYNKYINLCDVIRYIRDQRGDDKCYKDWYKLYALLPEGFIPPIEDETLELENCKKYIKACHDPNIQYVSPQIRIKELEEENLILKKAFYDYISGNNVDDSFKKAIELTKDIK